MGTQRPPQDPFPATRSYLAQAATQLRYRRAVRWMWRALGGGLLLASLTAVSSRFLWPWGWGPEWAVLTIVVVAAAAGFIAGALRPLPSPTELALLLDRRLATGELLVTGLHVQKGPNDAWKAAFTERLARALPRLAAPGRALPLPGPQRPWHGGFLGLTALVVLALPRHDLGLWSQPDPSSLEHAATELAAELEALEDALKGDQEEGLEGVAEALEALQDALNSEAVDPWEPMEALQQALDDRSGALEEGHAMDRALEQAAAELGRASSLTEAADAVADRDLQAAAEAAGDLGEGLSQEGRDAMSRAADALAESPPLSELSEALQAAADGPEGPLSEDLQQAFERAADAAERARDDRERMSEVERAAANLERFQEQLASEPETCDGGATRASDGTCEDGGEADPGEGDGQTAGSDGDDDGQAGSGDGDSQAGSGDGDGDGRSEGGGDGPGHHDDGDGLGTSASGRGTGSQPLTEGPSDSMAPGTDAPAMTLGVDPDDGAPVPFETPVRAEEVSADGAFQTLPAPYQDAARQAVVDERVPPGYRDALQRYFETRE